MICFDKLKIITSINNINDINKDKFQSIYKEEILQSYKYKQNTPYSLLILVNYTNNELVIEFSSKILKDNSNQLININNIHECLYNINQLNICSLNIDKIISDSDITKCDVTMDISYSDIKTLETQISTNLVNYKKWICKSYKNGFSIENVASTPRHKIRLIIYDKKEELKKSNNTSFINSLLNPDEVLSFYEEKIRFELNINTMKQIRDFLEVKDNQLMSILSTNANPIKTVIHKAVKEAKDITCDSDYKNYIRRLVLEDCNNDLNNVEKKLRSFSSKNTSIKRLMAPYRQLYHHLQNSKDIDIITLVS